MAGLLACPPMSVHDIGDHELRIRQLEEEIAKLKKIIATFYPLETRDQCPPGKPDEQLTA
jgi:hypothetical protein